MSVNKDISELLKAGVITQETADKIQEYYRSRSGSSAGKLFIVFGILGALLVGLGVILIIAHNWDQLPRATKTIFAFLPLLIGHVLGGFVLIKKPTSTAWREGVTTFLFFAVGASIALVSQIYNIPGDLSSFLLTWMLLCLPLMYVMNSSMGSLLYLTGITWYAGNTGYWSYPTSGAYLYWPLLAAALPYYYFLFRKKPNGNFMTFHNWLIPFSVMIVLGTVSKNADDLMFVAYISLFGLFYLLGSMDFFVRQKLINNGYKIIGSLGTTVLLLSLSFNWFWKDLRRYFKFDDIVTSPEFLAATIISLSATVLLYFYQRKKPLSAMSPSAPMFLLFIGAFILGLYSPIAVVLINLYVFLIGILTIREGAAKDHLGILNHGLLIITALVVCRFFDTNLSFVVRGILFVLVGAGFFFANYRMLKKRKAHAA